MMLKIIRMSLENKRDRPIEVGFISWTVSRTPRDIFYFDFFLSKSVCRVVPGRCASGSRQARLARILPESVSDYFNRKIGSVIAHDTRGRAIRIPSDSMIAIGIPAHFPLQAALLQSPQIDRLGALTHGSCEHDSVFCVSVAPLVARAPHQ